MADDDYELMSQKDIEKLKKELTQLRKTGKTPSGGNVVLSAIDKLNETIAGLTEVFKEASMELKLSDNDPYAKRFSELNDQISSVLEQNEKIAEAILTVADLTKELKESVESLKKSNSMSEPSPFGDSMGMEQMPPMGGMPPPMAPPFNPGSQPFGSPPGPPQGPPPGPPMPPDRRGMFGFK